MIRALQTIQLPRVRPDTALLVALALIGGIGLVMVGSASVAVADRLTDDPMYFFYRQAVFALVGLVAGFAVLHVPMRVWQANTFTLLAIGLVLLLIVLIPGIGHAVNGARRWIDLGPVSMQASEPARFCLILYVAGYAARRQTELATSWGGLFRPMFFMALASFLLLIEPDFGAAAVMVAVAAIVLFLAGARLTYLLVLGSLAGTAVVGLVLSSPYRLARLVSFADPWAHPYASGFQLTQSLIAIGRGEIAGVGLGNSVQKLLYLPETHTDFLFAIYAEEFGLLGTVLLIGLFATVVWRGFVIARRAIVAGQLFAGFVAYGMSSWLVLQAFLNIAVNMGLLPTKGLTLPLMSYGGSSLVMMCVLCALLIRVDIETRVPEKGGAR
ncbi:cell division protein FtsW [Salinisphaera shabanensis T35B1]|jgi:cell division protein FtsW|uniref:Probable peptidoglycan glycosyltransferase FtsW n=1 Tax=Salinisphaera shabanensis E1L3A TaxID=1033802 RepID=U2G380_9GAMM|nr:putative lipid II flippase FtsW [Salinisphaera shabanensis]ERJ20588.1 Lipid II flippase FtsW protein [Salinisphaera shabanensis E1L3A]